MRRLIENNVPVWLKGVKVEKDKAIEVDLEGYATPYILVKAKAKGIMTIKEGTGVNGLLPLDVLLKKGEWTLIAVDTSSYARDGKLHLTVDTEAELVTFFQ